MLENEALPFGETEGDFSAVDKARVVEALNKVLPPGTLMYDTEDLRPYECDGLAAYRALPLVVALPTTEEQVVAVLRIVSELHADAMACHVVAAAGWLIAFLPWVLRSTFIYTTPRADAKPG